MRVLFDQAKPVPIREFLVGHTCAHSRATGLGHAQERRLVDRGGARRFEVLLTIDKHMRYQQNVAGRTIAVVVIGVQNGRPFNRDVALVVVAVNALTPGSFSEVDISIH